MKATLPPDCVRALGIEVVGDQVAITATAILPDGSAEVSTGDDSGVVVPYPEPVAVPGTSNPAVARMMGGTGF